MSINPKHRPLVLTLPSETNLSHPLPYLPGPLFHETTLGEFLDTLNDNALYAPRYMLETNPAYRHVISYLPISQVGADGVKRYFAYQRGQGIGEERLMGQKSIGIGGHCDLQGIDFDSDDTYGDFVDIAQQFTKSIEDEVYEEVAMDIDGDSNVPVWNWEGDTLNNEMTVRLITSTANPTDACHLGVVFEIELPPHATACYTLEDELDSLGMFTLDELMADIDAYESWSQSIIRELAAQAR